MAQPTPKTTLPSASQLIASMPVSNSLASYIQAAASGDRSAIFHLFVAVFTITRAALRCLIEHYQAHPRALTIATLARINYCAARIKAILYTLSHAPERFLTPAQLRALTRARAILAHICRQPVDFSPLTPWITSPDACPAYPRSAVSASPASPTSPASPASPIPASPRLPLSASSSPANPLLLPSPGCALVSVLLQLAAIYGISAASVPAQRPSQTPSIPSTTPQDGDQSIISNDVPVKSLSPHSDLRAPHLQDPQYPLHSPP